MSFRLYRLVFLASVLLTGCSGAGEESTHPLRVALIPADGGTEDGTRADYEPVFEFVEKATSLTFEISVGQSYNAVVEAMCSGAADIAFLGPVTYLQARHRGCAELLAVGVDDGVSVYYAGIFAQARGDIRSIEDLEGRSIALGDVNSTSSFVFPLAMILDAGIDPIRDLGAIRLTGSHANSLASLVQGQVDAAAASFDSFEKAVRQNAIDPREVRAIGRSAEIPFPPLVMRRQLPEALKTELRAAFASVHRMDGMRPGMLRGYAGRQIDRYEVAFDPTKFDVTAAVMARVDKDLKAAIVEQAGAR